jgi:hypothetical protein
MNRWPGQHHLRCGHHLVDLLPHVIHLPLPISLSHMRPGFKPRHARRANIRPDIAFFALPKLRCATRF